MSRTSIFSTRKNKKTSSFTHIFFTTDANLTVSNGFPFCHWENMWHFLHRCRIIDFQCESRCIPYTKCIHVQTFILFSILATSLKNPPPLPLLRLVALRSCTSRLVPPAVAIRSSAPNWWPTSVASAAGSHRHLTIRPYAHSMVGIFIYRRD